MPHSRNTSDPTFGDWVTETALLPTALNGGWPSLNLVRERPTLIPNYQRGISWDDEQVDELIYSTSPVIGTVVVGRFDGPPAPYLSASLLGRTDEYEELADGLQRLSAGVCLLNGLQGKVLAPGANFAHAQPAFAAVAARYSGAMAVVSHNHSQLKSHPRRAIREQYALFAQSIDSWMDRQLVPQQLSAFADAFTQLMLIRPIALDRWDGFVSGLELMNTFLGLNTIRVELGPVDLLRAHLVMQATKSGWSDSDVEAFENDFTEVFTTNGTNASDLLPFVNAVLKCVSGGAASAPTVVFPSWGSLDKANDVDPFLDFALAFKNGSNNYLDQIRAVGSIPFGIVMAGYLSRYRTTHQLPSFLMGSITASDEGELHAMLCASIRSTLARKLGYLSPIITDCLKGATATLHDAADRVSRDASGVDMFTQLTSGWLSTMLESVDKKSAKTVFIAMDLPTRIAGVPLSGGPFTPIAFGRRASNWAVDHLLPEASLQDSINGYGEGKRLRNLAPLPGAQNSSARHASPSVKLISNVATYYSNALSSHPYCAWLTSQASGLSASQLDDQAELRPNSLSKLGDKRIEHIADELALRL